MTAPATPASEPVYMGLPHERYLRPRFYIAALLTVPVLVLAMGPMVWPALGHVLDPVVSGWLQAAATTPVFLWAGAPFIGRWWRSIRERDANMFTLTVTGTGAAYGYSLGVLLFGRSLPGAYLGAHGLPLYFEATAFTTTIVLLGQILEQRAHARTDAAIRGLMQLAPATAHRIREDGREEDVPVGEVRPGARLRVRPGESLPVDGTVVEGRAELDESMLTGESLPVTRGPGAVVRAGTLNATGTFVYRADQVGADTLLARIIRLVEAATESEAPIQRVADRAAAWFAPAVFTIATAALLGWTWFGPERGWLYGLINAVAVLILACPCALGLATPVSLVTGIGRGAQAGVLVRDAAALETLAGAQVLLFDKTGTLTAGRPEVVAVAPGEGLSAPELLRWAAAAEAASEHPLARAIVERARADGIALPPATDFRAEPGAGVRATVAGRVVAVERAPAGAGLADHPEATLVAVSLDGRAAGLIAFADPPKPEAATAVAELHRLGFRLQVVSVDRTEAVRAVAARLGIESWEAAVSPERKLALVRAHQTGGQRVVFAGDGLNDAPALAAADVGIAMGTGTDVAMATAGLVLVRGDLAALVRAVHLSRAVLANVKQNLFWAFAYNAAGLPLAAGAFYPFTGWLLHPMVAGLAMSLSSITVVSNALRLRHARL